MNCVQLLMQILYKLQYAQNIKKKSHFSCLLLLVDPDTLNNFFLISAFCLKYLFQIYNNYQNFWNKHL